MTIFMGSWEHVDAFHRIATIAACMSIVVTAVYILRAIGQTAMGPPHPQPFSTSGEGGNSFTLTDATWNEKLAAIILVAGILAIGIAPGWLNDLLRPGAEIIMQKISAIK
jgi:NADH-quinone oxidoreductase subunit M